VHEPLPLPPPPASSPPPYAGFWVRALALLIDGLVLAVIEAPVLLPNVWLPVWRSLQETMRTGVRPPSHVAYGWGLVGVAISYLYACVMIGRWNATVGKFAVGIRVRKANGEPAGWREAALRPLLETAISLFRSSTVGIFSLVDYLWMVWDKQSQTLHDKIAGTIVVKR
jgi:uncharacterized RDD family membrane protein YckC